MSAKAATTSSIDQTDNASASVIPLPGKAKVDVKPKIKPQKLRRIILAISAIVCIAIPTLLGAFYFLFVASDRYAAGAGFSVRSMDSGAAGGDFLGALSGLSSVGSTTTDSYILIEYMQSRELVEKLQQEVDFVKAYSNDEIDFLYRLEPNQPIEVVVKYWEGMISTSYDNSSEIIQFEVEAFTAEDAERVAMLVVKHSQSLINSLSANARNEAVLLAKKEVASAELRSKLIREELRSFRAASSAVDPSASAAASLQIITELESQLIQERTRLAILSASVSPDSRPARALKRVIASIEDQLNKKKAEIGGSIGGDSESGTDLSKLLAEYEKLQVEQEFAQQAYTVSLASLERSRAEADRQQRFLAVFRAPSIPEKAIYPERYLNIFLILLISFVIWTIGTMIVYSVRDHLR
ncbi:MAG: lipopolysaccharide biosynthesis protein [Lentilitoribacter sp.]